jgi:APA family basic amino acid/polyamine antiporter
MELKKNFGKLEVFSFAAGGMISSGIFILPAIAYSEAGLAIIPAYFLAGMLMLPALFSQMELATALPKAGGIYFFSERILGSAAGVVTGFASWFSLSMKSAFALIGIGAFVTLLYPSLTEIQIKYIAAGSAVFFGLLNLLSVKSSGKLQIGMVFVLLLILLMFIILGYPSVSYSHFIISNNNFQYDKIIATTGLVFISYGGLTKVASVAEEVKDLRKNLVPGTFAAFVVVQTIYLLVLFVMIGVMQPADIIKSLTPISDTAGLFFSHKGVTQVLLYLTASAGMLAFITTANAGILSASRNPMAMGRDGLLPEGIGRLTKKGGAPYIAVILTTAFMVMLIIGLDIVKLVKIASLFQILLFIMVNISVIIIRSSNMSNYKPTFKSPLYPLPQIAGIILYLFLIKEMGFFTIISAVVFIAGTVFWYLVYARSRVNRKSALVHVIERLSNPELIKDENEVELDSELLDILVERNEIVEDRFDSIIRQCPVLDYDKTITRDDLFNDLAEKISTRMGLDPEKCKAKLMQREEEASTLLYDGVALPHAVPHVIIEGEHLFDIILVRNKYGIKWNEDGDIVYTAFSLIGTKDERNFHLKALAAIAQLLMDPEFEKEWTKAKTENDLRTAVLLVKRKRQHNF